jgi:hypothetical protein
MRVSSPLAGITLRISRKLRPLETRSLEVFQRISARLSQQVSHPFVSIESEAIGSGDSEKMAGSGQGIGLNSSENDSLLYLHRMGEISPQGRAAWRARTHSKQFR